MKKFENFKNKSVYNVLNIFKTLKTYPVEVVLTKYLILAGIDDEQKLMDFLHNNDKTKMMQTETKQKIHNAYRDITITQTYDFEKIPDLFK